jgi:hypothetical protein
MPPLLVGRIGHGAGWAMPAYTHMKAANPCSISRT